MQGYPKGKYVGQIRQEMEQLENKMAKKMLSIAQNYYKWSRYQAALIMLQNLQKDFPSALCSENIRFLELKARYAWSRGKVSEEQKHEQQRLALEVCQRFISTYPGSMYVPQVQRIQCKLQKTR